MNATRRQAILRRDDHFRANGRGRRGFSLLELLVVVGILSLLLSILVPAVNKARQQAKRLLSTNNLRQTAHSVTLYTLDSNDHFPESVATVGFGNDWHWVAPTMITGYESRSQGRYYRSMSAYLNGYITQAKILRCPNAPEEPVDLEKAWEEGELWDNPDTAGKDALYGNYCFYWGYTGYIGPGRLFHGPRTAAGERGRSQILVSDYFGYDHYTRRYSFGSCEQFTGASVTSGLGQSACYWSCPDDQTSLQTINVRPQASYADGSVQAYTGKEVAPMRVIWSRPSEPYEDSLGSGPGVYYLPLAGL